MVFLLDEEATHGNDMGVKGRRQSWWDPRFGRHEFEDETARKRHELETSQPRYELGTCQGAESL